MPTRTVQWIVFTLALIAANMAANAQSQCSPAPCWQELTNQIPDGTGAGVSLLLTDGRVMMQSNTSRSEWWVLTPDSSGNYLDGTWAQISSMPTGYAPKRNVDQLIFATLVQQPRRIRAQVVRQVVFLQWAQPESEANIHEEGGHEYR